MAQERRPTRCGWCINEDHENCVVTIEVSTGVWRCPCDVSIVVAGGPLSGQVLHCDDPRIRGTRCTKCRRRGVEVDDKSRCIDQDNCKGYLAQQRAADPAFQMMDQITHEQVAHAPKKEARGTGPREPKVTSGECQCCGGATKGGKFLPGHDARYVTQQAQAFVALDASVVGNQEGAHALYTKMEDLGPALHAKWVKRVEALRAKAEEAK